MADWFEAFREGMREHEAERRPFDLARYELGERLGEGGAAAVHRGWDLELLRPVAIKILRDGGCASRTQRARFEREARVAAGLSHPNVVTIFDAGEAEGRLYLVMELVDGKPLGALLEAGGLRRRERLELLEKVARGMAVAHAGGIVHRDLKPANILVSASGEPKVGDFGLAHLREPETRLTQTGLPLGTPAYMAPEQVSGTEEITPRADVYALGAILYEMLTCRTPHAAPSLLGLYAEIMREEPVPPRRLDPDIPRELEAICQKALRKDPRARYADAGGFAEDLARFLRDEPVSARPSGWLARARSAVRRKPAQAGAAVIGIVMAALSVALFASPAPSVAERRERLAGALERAIAAQTDKADAGFGRLPRVRLVATLEAAAEGEAPQDLLEYDLRNLGLDGGVFALATASGKVVYASDPAGVLRPFAGRMPPSGRVFAWGAGGLWVLFSKPVTDTEPERDNIILGVRWVGLRIEPSWLQPLGELGRVAWAGADGRLLAGTADPAAVRDHHAFPERVGAVPGPIERTLFVPVRGTWDPARTSAALLGVIALALLAWVGRSSRRRQVEAPPPLPGAVDSSRRGLTAPTR